MAQGLRLTAVTTGMLTLDKGLLTMLQSGTIKAPVPVYIAEHPRKGLILFDTGVSHRCADDPDKHWAPGLAKTFGLSITREEAIDQQLVSLGYRTADVKYVVMSHMHLDHAGGMEHFPNATFVVQEEELRHAWWPDRFTRLVYNFNDYAPTRNFNFLEVNGDVDLFQDGSIRLTPLPGHTAGQQGAILKLQHRGPVFLAFDASHTRVGYDNYLPMPFNYNHAQAMSTIHKVRVVEQSGIPTLFAHAAEDWMGTAKNGEYWD